MTSDTNLIGSPKEVFFLGAGASALAGVPTFSNFRDKLGEVSGKLESEPEIHYLFLDIGHYWINNFDDYNIEQLYAAIEMNETLGIRTEDLKTDDIVKFIYLTIHKSLTKDTLCDNVFESFLTQIRQADAAIITTNWDIVLESSKSNYLEEEWVDYESVNAYELPNNISANDVGYCQFKIIPILKLHGSLNWGFCQNCGKIYYLNEKNYHKLILSEVECKNRECEGKHSKLKIVIVPPTLSKLVRPVQTTEPSSLKLPYFQLVSIWNRAYDYLKSCEKIYFIGYSFPETDVQMRFFISNALRENTNLKDVIVISTQKHGNSRIAFEERYISALPKGIKSSKTKFYYRDFKHFCTKDLPIRHQDIF